MDVEEDNQEQQQQQHDDPYYDQHQQVEFYQPPTQKPTQNRDTWMNRIVVLIIPCVMIIALLIVIVASKIHLFSSESVNVAANERHKTTWNFDLNSSAKLPVGVTYIGVGNSGKWFSKQREPHRSSRGYTDYILLLLHGFPLGASDTWTSVADYLKDEFSIIYPNQRGFGSSLIRPVQLNLDQSNFDIHSQLVSDVRRYVLEILRRSPSSKIVIAGHDLGGTIAYSFGSIYGEEFKGKVVGIAAINSLHSNVWSEMLKNSFEFRVNGSYLRDLIESTPMNAATLWDIMFKNQHEVVTILTSRKAQILKEWTGDVQIESMRNWYRALFDAPADGDITDYEFMKNLIVVNGGSSNYTVPDSLYVLAISGSKDKLTNPTDFVSNLDILRQNKDITIPKLFTHLVDGGSHWLPIDSPQVIANDLRKFIYAVHNNK
jgi:pimeloyl-ACP methyl ester carboxylesterase